MLKLNVKIQQYNQQSKNYTQGMARNQNKDKSQQKQSQSAMQIEHKQKQEEKVGEMEVQESEQSSYSSEDDDGKLLTDKVEGKLLSVVAMIRNKNPDIYKVEKPIFQDEDFSQELKPQRPIEKLTYKKMAQQNYNSQSSQQNEEDNNNVSVDKIKERLKQKLNQPLQNDQEDEMFKVKEKRNKVKKQKNMEKDKISSFLDDTFKEGGDKSKQLLGELWSHDEKLDETDKFLRSYILDKKWITSKHNQEYQDEQMMIDEEDEDRSVQMDEYEANYNFRFEEPDGNKIVQYPRNVPESLRVKPQTRKQKRKRLEQKKKEQEQEIRRQAEQKKQEFKEKILQKLHEKDQNGNQMIDQGQNSGQAVDHDWFFCDDCTKPLQQRQLHYICPECDDYMLCQECHELIIHKHRMNKAIIPEGAGPPKQEAATKVLYNLKGCRNCHRKIPENLNRYEYTDKSSYITSSLCEKCYDQSNLQVKKKFKLIQNKQINYEQLLQKDPQKIKQLTCQKDIDQLVDEYMKNDFEDILADGLKAKFKYISVKPESYGLSDEQILFGDDKEMNKYVSIKKLAPYRDDERDMKLRNSIYNKKIKGIQKSMQRNKQIMNKDGLSGVSRVRKLDKMKNRNEILKKRRENMKKKLKVANISNIQDEKRYFIPHSRLESYGLAAPRQRYQ